MISPEPVGFINTVAPLLVMAAGAVLLPGWLTARATRSHRAVALGVGLTAAGLTLVGAVVFAAIYGWQGALVGAAFGQNPTGTTLFFLRISAKGALVWAPVLALVWYVAAQAVERRRGEDIARK